jgi:hypothetical protein
MVLSQLRSEGVDGAAAGVRGALPHFKVKDLIKVCVWLVCGLCAACGVVMVV